MTPFQRNILIDHDGHAQICDFGLVRIFLDEGSSGMTTTTHHTGTVRYLAYELVLAGEDAMPTTASDIYAVGCIGLEVVFMSDRKIPVLIRVLSSSSPKFPTQPTKATLAVRYLST